MLTFEVEKFTQNAFYSDTEREVSVAKSCFCLFSWEGLRYTVHNNVAEKEKKMAGGQLDQESCLNVSPPEDVQGSHVLEGQAAR